MTTGDDDDDYENVLYNLRKAFKSAVAIWLRLTHLEAYNNWTIQCTCTIWDWWVETTTERYLSKYSDVIQTLVKMKYHASIFRFHTKPNVLKYLLLRNNTMVSLLELNRLDLGLGFTAAYLR